MKKAKISFRHYGGSGPLSIYWYDGAFGDAEEAISGNGVCWYSPSGEILAVEFDDVDFSSDEQSLELQNKIEELFTLRSRMEEFIQM